MLASRRKPSHANICVATGGSNSPSISGTSLEQEMEACTAMAIGPSEEAQLAKRGCKEKETGGCEFVE